MPEGPLHDWERRALRAMLQIGDGTSGGRALVSIHELAQALRLTEQEAAETLERLGALGWAWVVRGSHANSGGRGGLTPMAAIISDLGRAALGLDRGRAGE